MYYVQKGTSGDAILWLHGWGCDGSIFLPIADKVDGRVHYLPDLSGFGRTPAPPVPYSVADYADEVYRLILANKLTDVLIVGHSFGCRVAYAFGITCRVAHIFTQALVARASI